jgi:hypothetical protein
VCNTAAKLESPLCAWRSVSMICSWEVSAISWSTRASWSDVMVGNLGACSFGVAPLKAVVPLRTGNSWIPSVVIWQAAVLRSIPKEAFADSFQKLYERCQPCVVKDGDYFEGQ